MKGVKLVSLISGGLDSTVLLHLLKSQGCIQTALIVDYGQKHVKEVDFAISAARRLEIPYEVVAIRGGGLFKSALTIPEMEISAGKYSTESMAATVVPNRNAVFGNLAAALAISLDYDGIALAIHAGDHELYPDCRPKFVAALTELLWVATDTPLLVYAPFITWDKASIVMAGHELGVDMEKTWSCYEGRRQHCGVCGTCIERKEAFVKANVLDATVYEQ